MSHDACLAWCIPTKPLALVPLLAASRQMDAASPDCLLVPRRALQPVLRSGWAAQLLRAVVSLSGFYSGRRCLGNACGWLHLWAG